MTDPTNLDDMVAGQPFEMPMRQDQREYIERLLETCTYTDEHKALLQLHIDMGITDVQADDLIDKLKKAQLGSIDLARDGRLTQKDLGKALKKLVDMKNT